MATQFYSGTCFAGVNRVLKELPMLFINQYLLFYKEMDHCHPNPCLHGGECEQSETGYLCKCIQQYQGTNCEGVLKDS